MRIAQPRRAGALFIFMCVLAGAGTAGPVGAQVAPDQTTPPDPTTPTTAPTTAPPPTVAPTVPPPTSVDPAPPESTTTTEAPPAGAAPGESTTTVPIPVPEDTTTTEAPDDHPTTAVPWELAPEFDLPEYDTLEVAGTMLALVKAQLTALTTQRDAALARADRIDAVVADAQREVERISERLKNRAVASYMAADSIFDVKIHGDDTRKILVASMETLDRNEGKSQKALRQLIATKQREAAEARATAEAAGPEIDQLKLAQKALEDKINGTVDLVSPVAPGPNPIALAAAKADQSVGRMIKAVALSDGSGPAAVEQLKADLTVLAMYVQPKAVVPVPTPSTGTQLPGATPTTPTTPAATAPVPADPAAAAPVAGAPVAAVPLSPVEQLAATWLAMDLRRLQVMLFALQQTGKEYVWAAAGPNSYDCSGLLMRAWAMVGVKLPHFSGSQIRSGPPVLPTDLQPTDFLGYGADSSQHITMYIGGGRVVEAKGRAYGVVVSDAKLNGLAGAARIG